MTTIELFEINPELDRKALADAFAQKQRVQIHNVLTTITANVVQNILAQQTKWGIAWQAGANGPHGLRREDFVAMTDVDRSEIGKAVSKAAQGSDYTFMFAQYRMLDAYLQNWDSNGPHDLLLEHLNNEPFLDLVRAVTGDDNLIKADAQATLYGPGHFLGVHDDSHVAEGWKIAYVLNMGAAKWRPEWGGYLNFLDNDGNIVEGYIPRFNTLNLFRVPQRHEVSFVPPFAPPTRLAITGWLRDR